jgi:hypothetical protein
MKKNTYTRYVKKQIREHGEKLITIFPNAKIKDPILLWECLREIEFVAHRNAEMYCNGEIEADEYCTRAKTALAEVCEVLGDSPVPVFINGDPRGYALKIKSDWMRFKKADLHKDWGDYGILAPSLDS